VAILFGDTCVFAKGEPQDVDLEALTKYLQAKEVRIAIDLGLGNGQATVWGCDLTEGYVQINALYTT
jgi:glutamate N-acetyltransferase/amino-acid N-acetyltransferase